MDIPDYHADVPPDIIHAIIDKIEDTPTLKQCAYVSHLFRTHIRKRLFETITLGLFPQTNTESPPYATRVLANLELLLKSDPTLGGFVRDLTIHLFLPTWEDSAALQESICSVLRAMDNVRCLTLTGPNEWAVAHLWNSPAFSEAISSLLRLPSVTSVNICYLTIPLDLVTSAIYCKTLIINHVRITNPEAQSAVETTGQSSLKLSVECLDIEIASSQSASDFEQVPERPNSRIRLPHLHTLRIGGIRYFDYCDRLLKLYGYSVRYLRLSFVYSHSRGKSHVLLSIAWYFNPLRRGTGADRSITAKTASDSRNSVLHRGV